ncbi:MAG: Type 1 glutamine amidotransferase-like domain-containing protein [Candidatus Nomurabacteria bacterium]|nr:Type 1 glutamine amidotransferase-like domain-containing protein [Candidatus Nomurabacteria bacterium]
MQTKFILYGGFDPEQTDNGNPDFSLEIMKETPENGMVLIVPFSKEVDRIIPTTERVKNELNAQKWQKNIKYEVASQENFILQLESADVVYFQGGSSLKLLEVLKKYPNLKDLLKGKIVAGDSAGANVMCTFFYTPSTDKVLEGLGILPIKIIPHYKEKYAGKFESIGPDLEEVLLPEYTYKVFKY